MLMKIQLTLLDFYSVSWLHYNIKISADKGAFKIISRYPDPDVKPCHGNQALCFSKGSGHTVFFELSPSEPCFPMYCLQETKMRLAFKTQGVRGAFLSYP